MKIRYWMLLKILIAAAALMLFSVTKCIPMNFLYGDDMTVEYYSAIQPMPLLYGNIFPAATALLCAVLAVCLGITVFRPSPAGNKTAFYIAVVTMAGLLCQFLHMIVCGEPVTMPLVLILFLLAAEIYLCKFQ